MCAALFVWQMSLTVIAALHMLAWTVTMKQDFEASDKMISSISTTSQTGGSTRRKGGASANNLKRFDIYPEFEMNIHVIKFYSNNDEYLVSENKLIWCSKLRMRSPG